MTSPKHNIALIDHRRGGLLQPGERLRLAARAGVRAQRRAAGHRGVEQVVQPEPQPRRQRQLHLHPESESFQATTSARRAVRGPQSRRHAHHSAARSCRGRRTPTRRPASACSRTTGRCGTSASTAQEELLLFDRRLLLTAGVRADRSSNNGDTDKFFFYPKAAASYRFIRPFGGVDEIKLRGAYGQTGNQPLFGAQVLVRHHRHDRRHLRDVPGQPGGRPLHQAGAADRVRGRLRRAVRRRTSGAELHGVPADHQRPAPGADASAEPGHGEPDLQLGQQAAEPRRRGGAHRLADSDART